MKEVSLDSLFKEHASDPNKDRSDAEWQRVSKPPTAYLKWNSPGQALEGVWLGTVPGKFGPQGQMDVQGKLVVFPLHTVLARELEGVAPGTPVKIEYLGLEMGKAGRQYKAFSIFVK